MTHLIFVCKYRKHLLVQMGEQIKRLMHDVAGENGMQIMEVEVDKNHIHLLVGYKPTKSILQVVRLFKQISTYRIWRTGGNKTFLRKHFWNEQTFWSDGYFACSIGNASACTIQNYIRNQG